MNVSRVAELTSIAIAFAGLCFWTGTTAGDVANNKAEIARVKEKTEAAPVNIAVLQTQMQAVQDEQKKQGEKLDKILERLPQR